LIRGGKKKLLEGLANAFLCFKMNKIQKFEIKIINFESKSRDLVISLVWKLNIGVLLIDDMDGENQSN